VESTKEKQKLTSYHPERQHCSLRWFLYVWLVTSVGIVTSFFKVDVQTRVAILTIQIRETLSLDVIRGSVDEVGTMLMGGMVQVESTTACF